MWDSGGKRFWLVTLIYSNFITASGTAGRTTAFSWHVSITDLVPDLASSQMSLLACCSSGAV
jgi:hypothetical protein